MNNFQTFPNQKVVEIVAAKHNKDNPYGVINRIARKSALYDLSKSTYLVWEEFAMNQNGYKFALSCKTICEECNIKETSYHKAIKELEEKGYMQLVKGNYYKFYEYPNEPEQEEKPMKKEYREKKTKTEKIDDNAFSVDGSSILDDCLNSQKKQEQQKTVIPVKKDDNMPDNWL